MQVHIFYVHEKLIKVKFCRLNLLLLNITLKYKYSFKYPKNIKLFRSFLNIFFKVVQFFLFFFIIDIYMYYQNIC